MQSRREFIRSSFRSRHFSGGVFYVLLQQTLVALSIFSLASAAQQLSEPSDALPWLVAFVIFSILPYTPGILADRQFQLWFTHCLGIFFSNAIYQNPFSPRHYNLVDAADEKTAIFASNSPEVIYDYCQYIPAILTAGINATLVLLVVAGVSDLRILLTYIISLTLCSLLIFWFGPWAAKAANSAESRRASLVEVSMNIWPNLTLQNKPNVAGWHNFLRKKLENYTFSIRQQAFVQSISQQSIAIASFGPTSIFFIYLCYTSIENEANLAVLIAVAPRIFQILLSLNDFATMIFAWNQIKGRLSIIESYFNEPNADHFRSLSDYPDVKVIDLSDPCKKLILSADLAKSTRGRAILTGPNGAGKTSALLLLKEIIGEAGIFIPSQSKLVFDQERHSGSTGQRKLYEIQRLLDLPDDITHILLDEWDANLDDKNTDCVDKIIDELSGTKMVIEIRHKR